MGTPSIVSHRGGLPETIVDGSNGFILSSLSPSGIRNALEQAKAANLETFRASAERHGIEVNQTEPFEHAWNEAVT